MSLTERKWSEEDLLSDGSISPQFSDEDDPPYFIETQPEHDPVQSLPVHKSQLIQRYELPHQNQLQHLPHQLQLAQQCQYSVKKNNALGYDGIQSQKVHDK